MRKTIIKFLPVAALVALTGAACSPKDIDRFAEDNGKADVYFDFEKSEVRYQLTNQNISFFDDKTKADSIVRIPVRLSGERVGRDRHFRVLPLTMTQGDDTNVIPAVAGTHYEALKSGYVIPAGEGVGYFDLKILNDHATMDSRTVEMEFALMPSDDFEVSFVTSDGSNLNRVKVKTSDKLLMPDFWNPSAPGNWGDLKGWTATSNELFRIASGVKDIPRYGTGVSITDGQKAVAAFMELMTTPEKWVQSNTGYTIAQAGTSEGFALYTFTVNGTDNVFHYRMNTNLGVEQWLDRDKNTFSIYY